MVRKTGEVLHFVELGGIDDRKRIFLAVHDMGLQRRIDLAELHAGRRCAQRLEKTDREPADRHTNLYPVQIAWRVNGTGGGGDLAEAVVPDPGHHMQAHLFNLPGDECAEIAIHRRPHGLIIRKGKANGIDRSRWH